MLLPLVLLLSPGVLAAEDASHQVVVRPVVASGAVLDGARLLVEPVAQREPGAQAPQVIEMAWRPDAAALPVALAPGVVWEARLTSPELWSSPVVIDLLAAPLPREVVVSVYPTAPVTFKPRVAEGAPAVTGARVRFQPSAGTRPGVGEVACAADGEELVVCSVPRGLLDLKLRLPGHSSYFAWECQVGEGGLDLGEVSLVPGASLVGRVETDQGSPPEPPATVYLVPTGTEPAATARDQILIEQVETEPRGFFQFAGVPAGSYRVRVESTGFAPFVTAPLALQGTVEGELAEPLVLERPLELRVRFVPAADRDGAPWGVSLLSSMSGRVELIDRGESDPGGSWKSKPLPAGSYELLVLARGGARLLARDVELAPNHRELVVEIETVGVAGEVLLSGEPVAGAAVVFGGRSGLVTVELKTDDDGQFTGELPRAGTWEVEVVAAEPPIARRIAEVEVPTPAAGEAAWVEIHLPGTVLTGDVVDEDGSPVEGVHVLLVSQQQRPVQTRTDDEGEFEFSGLEPGEYRVEARWIRPNAPALVAAGEWVTLDEDAPAVVHLVVGSQRTVRGRVVAAGRPVAGAALRYSSPGTSIVAAPARSAVDGGFALEVPQGVETLVLTALLPGALLHQESLSVAAGQELLIQLQQGPGGTLVLEGLGAGAEPFVLHDGRQRFAVPLLREWASANGVRETAGTSLVVPALEPGIYRLCQGMDMQCVEGYLPPTGELMLDLTLTDEPERESL